MAENRPTRPPQSPLTQGLSVFFLSSSLGNKEHLSFLLQTCEHPQSQLIPSQDKVTPVNPAVFQSAHLWKAGLPSQITDLSAHQRRRTLAGRQCSCTVSHSSQEQLGSFAYSSLLRLTHRLQEALGNQCVGGCGGREEKLRPLPEPRNCPSPC